MSRKCVCVALVAIFVLAASRSAQAQVTVDVTKINCDQFVHHTISEPRLIAAWLSGYYDASGAVPAPRGCVTNLSRTLLRLLLLLACSPLQIIQCQRPEFFGDARRAALTCKQCAPLG